MSLINLSNDFAIIKISGMDSLKFLQGQITNDILLLDTQDYIFASNLNIKGRILVNFIIYKNNEDYFLFLNSELVDMIILKLKMYIFRSKVFINRESLFIYFSDVSQNNLDGMNHNIQLFPNAFLCMSNKEMQDYNSDLKSWKLFLIKNKIPFIYKVNQEKFIPQHISMDQLNAISFKKGCYIGQEIVARIQYLGSIKRRLFSFRINTKVNIGDEVFSPLMNNQEVGTVVEVVYHNDLETEGLLSIQIGCIQEAFYDKDNQFRFNITSE